MYPLAAAILVSLGVAGWQFSRMSKEVVDTSAAFDARGFLDTVLNMRTVYARDVAGRIDSSVTPIRPDFAEHDGAIPPPATFTHLLGAELAAASSEAVDFRLYSDVPWPYRTDGGPKDDFEAEALEYLRANPSGRYQRTEQRPDGRRWQRYAIADRMKTSCVACHNAHPSSPRTDWEVGDVRGVLAFARPLDEIQAETDAAIATSRLWLGVAGTLTLVGLLLILRHWRAELAGRQQATEKVEATNEELRTRAAELDHARQAAEAASAAKSDFLANMSHEIRTPMTAILGFTDVIAEAVGDERTAEADAARTVRRNAQVLLAIINEILDISKLEAGQMTVESVETDIGRLVADVIALLSGKAEDKGIELNAVWATPIPEMVSTDPTRLRQILVNLVGNAVKFTEDGTVSVRVSFDEATSGLSFAIEDTGIGMTEAQAAHIFDAFTQADETMSRRFGGTGLGLSISRHFAQLLGGDIIVASTHHVGSTFTLEITPEIVDGTASHATYEAAVAAFESHGSIARLSGSIDADDDEASGIDSPKYLDGVRILLAEDGPDNQRLISFRLRKAGAEVAIAGNGRIAADLAFEAIESGCPFDVILMDMQMPVLDGYGATQELRRRGYTRPIIALTAHAMSGDRDRCIEAGCDEYATKPIDRVALLETVRQMADRLRTDADGHRDAA